ncbi:MAG: primosomal protein N' [Desulfovibrio sp.]|jgi:primosomal protein N' (replication factor Y)|nr:primosomal protein N' [Desulfovibrio sp.]
MYATVCLLTPPYADLSYELPPEFPPQFWRPGLRVAVPLGKGALRAGLVFETTAKADLPENVVCKAVAWPLESAPLLPGDLLDLARDLARRQGVTPGHILGHTLPPGLRSTRVRLRLLAEGRATSLSLRQILESTERANLALAVVTGQARLLPPAVDAAEEEFCTLLVDPPWPVRPSATRQIALLDHLYGHGAVNRRRLLQALGKNAAAALRNLLSAGHVALTRPDTEKDAENEEGIPLPPPPAPFALNNDQLAALQDLRAAMDKSAANRHESRLLFGVTGSGKTAVYLKLAKYCLHQGKSLLLLAPEVALAGKLRRDAARALPDAPLFFHHGYQSPSRREATFRALAGRREPCLVVGTRSALFLPVPRLGCVVMDEEHDASFKQDENLPYQAKEVAWQRMAQAGGLLLLGSATPDIKTFHAAETGHLPLLRLPRRVGGRPLPTVELVSIKPAGASSDCLLAPQSEEALRETLAKGEQAVVLLNRRGYAPLMYCLDCNATMRCPHCEIGLAYHKGREKLLCHYCGYTQPFPSPCPQCRGMNFLPLGEGTERLAEQLGIVAGKPVLRLDRDSARRADRMEEILAAFARQESPILVGTQMLSKGHHFPQVTLVVAADGDLGLNLPDYRAAERTFQLLVQSGGRAGRGEKPGRVLIQTRDTNHYCWQHIQSGDYAAFYAEEIKRRRLRRYPPFVCLALLRVSFTVDDANGPPALGSFAADIRARARELGVQALGPAPAPLPVLRGRRRFHCLLKANGWQNIRRLYFDAKAHKTSRTLRLFLDLDPVNML